MSLYPVLSVQDPDIMRRIDPNANGAVYAYAVASGLQSGMMFSDNAEHSLLVRHSCGFALLFGRTDEKTLRTAGEMILDPAPYARMFLFAPNEETVSFFAGDTAFAMGRRLFFRYPDDASVPPENTGAAAITADILEQISGGNIPSVSWDSPEAFLQHGGGFCEMRDGIPASWAYAAAVSERETDIGIETDARYRRQGLAFSAASAMIRRVRQAGKTPVWGCRAENEASKNLALALGFVQTGECVTVMKAT